MTKKNGWSNENNTSTAAKKWSKTGKGDTSKQTTIKLLYQPKKFNKIFKRKAKTCQKVRQIDKQLHRF